MEKTLAGGFLDDARDAGPWYREPWPWILMAGPALVVIAGIYTTVLAVRSDDGLVASDYYKRGLAVNQVIAREERARQYRVGAELTLAGGEARLRLQIATATPDTLRLRLAHPTRAGDDVEVLLSRVADTQYLGRANVAPGIARLVSLEDAAGQWRVSGELRKDANRLVMGEE